MKKCVCSEALRAAVTADPRFARVVRYKAGAEAVRVCVCFAEAQEVLRSRRTSACDSSFV